MKIAAYSYEEYVHLVKSFHGSLAPGLLIGGFIVDTALKNLPAGEFFDALCETSVCLPDAVQLLTPCTIGNGWLKVCDLGRFAVTLYEKESGIGIRVFLDPEKLKAWPEFHAWFFKQKPKAEQDFGLLLNEIREAGASVLSMQQVRIKPDLMGKRRLGNTAVCPECGEAYPLRDGASCLGCQGHAPYVGLSSPV
ncbi:MAG TPA: formylmethanofuran dehydrogenase subunit E family protein [Syntrophales bacterium]|jgi:formylmethanofuran dehydrogenase subunit E|nr:formylmethanofuran dehydrogenase subunit E family protein [Syntrophales bacterium]HQG34869.1 formylmethanofuran dehydrogenase subunit E family protein [Syntrophales bacterium]